MIALGGGALGSDRTRDLLRRRAWVVWLRVSPDVAWRRVEGSDRPLAQDRERFERRAAEREPTYRERRGSRGAGRRFAGRHRRSGGGVGAWYVGKPSGDMHE